MSSMLPSDWRAVFTTVWQQLSQLSPPLPSWPPSIKDILTWSVLSLSAVGVTSYVVIRTFFNWIIDDFILMRGVRRWARCIGDINIFDPSKFLEKHAKTIPNKTFLLYEDESYTFLQTNTMTNKYANAFHAAGISHDKAAAILMRNRPELLFSFYACLKLTVPLSFINTNLRAKALLHCIKEGDAKYLITDDDPDMLAAVDEISGDLKSSGIEVLVIGRTDKYNSVSDRIETSSSAPVSQCQLREISPETVAAYIFTSGTTGLPKAAKISYYRLARGASLYFIFGVTEKDVCYSPLPLYHSQALLTTHGAALLLGITFAFAKKFSVHNFWEDADKHGATVIAYIGETCRYLLTRPPSDKDRKHSVRLAIGNGLRKDIWNEFKNRFNIDCIGEFYAATEGNVGIGNTRNKFGSCGRLTPLPNLLPKASSVYFLQYDTENDEIVRDDSGLCKIAPAGTPGLLVAEVNDMARFDGYTNKQQSEKKIVRDVVKKGDMYFNTGDLLTRERDYYVYFVDRIGDTFRWKGENVSTQEVANALTELHCVEDCTVYGVSIPHMDGKCGMAAFALKHGVTITAGTLKEIYEHIESSMPAYARPIFIRFLPELQMTGTYKHQKFTLKQEGYNMAVTDVYVIDNKSATYRILDEQTYKLIQDGHMKL